jgi:membrane protease YdiL (CAAX protease family)
MSTHVHEQARVDQDNLPGKPIVAIGLDKIAQPFPVSPLAGVGVVVIVYLVAQALAELLLEIYPLLAGWSKARTTAWLGNTVVEFAYTFSVYALTLLAIYWFMRTRKLQFRDLGLLRPRLQDFGITLLAYPPYFILNAAAALAANAFIHVNTAQQQQLGFQAVQPPVDLILTFISLVIIPPIVEEIVMRGFLFSSLKRGMRVVPAALLTSVLFASAHLQFGSGAPLLWVAAIDTFILSLVLCYLRQKTNSLWAGIGLHALKNCLAFLAVFVLPRLHYSL